MQVYGVSTKIHLRCGEGEGVVESQILGSPDGVGL